MLSQPELVSLAHLLRDEKVLSVYVDGAVNDPGRRRVWRVELDRALRTIRRSLEAAPHDERTAFAECVTLLDEQLATLDGPTVRAPGWAAFITRNAVHSAAVIHAPTPTLARWEIGVHLTPYVRAFKQSKPVVVIVADARAARMYRYQHGALAREDTIRATAATEPPSHMGNPPAPGFHGGTRGSTGEASEQRALLAGTARLVSEVVPRAIRLAGGDGWIVVSGISRVAAQLARAVDSSVHGRVLLRESLDVHATDAAIETAAEASASALRDAADMSQVAAMAAIAHRGEATLGTEATRHALEQRCVRELYVTEAYVRDNDGLAEAAVRSALAQGASVEVVARDVAARLDALGGIGARLRYAPVGESTPSNVDAAAAAQAGAPAVPMSIGSSR